MTGEDLEDFIINKIKKIRKGIVVLKEERKIIIPYFGIVQRSSALAMRKNMLLLTDDSDARDLSEELGIQTHGIIFVLRKAVKSGLITKRDAIESLDSLVEKGFRISKRLLKYAKDVISSDP